MFWFSSGKKRVDKLEKETKRGFESVKKDVESIGNWIRHLNTKDKQLLDVINQIKRNIASIEDEIEGLKEAVSLTQFAGDQQQALKKQTAVGKQTDVYSVYNPVQTAVQTDNLYQILQNFSSNERLLIYTLMNTIGDMKLSYEDLARLLGKERSTVRGQINAIKQKSEGLIREVTEPNGKKRVFIDDVIKEKLEKYAKVRVKDKKKRGRNEDAEERGS